MKDKISNFLIIIGLLLSIAPILVAAFSVHVLAGICALGFIMFIIGMFISN